jgi:dihydroorotate dehydrogenase
MYKLLIRPILFLFDPEWVHHATFYFLKGIHNIGLDRLIKKLYLISDKKLESTYFGINFPNPVGLAAGFDKNAVLVDVLANFGFGFIEIGTVTPLPQKGNPKKRLFRLKKDKAIINRMGFNNVGVDAVVENLKKVKNRHIIIGGNIGKNTQTKPENYTADYITCFTKLHPYVHYFVLNVSCPNVSSHAKLTDKDYLIELITEVQKVNNTFKSKKPILLKIAPDLNTLQLDEIIEVVSKTNIDGIIATNTSVSREKLISANKKEWGGLSGKPIKEKSTAVIRYLASKSDKSFPIIGVGGIHSAADALDKIKAGASLIQIYTGFIYEGPSLIKKINKALLSR